MLRRDLGEFLFADAWARLKPEVRTLLLLMTRVGDVHDSQSLRICALTAGVAIRKAEEALDESGGIASVVNIEGDLNITFSRNFLDYANGRGKSHPDSPREEQVSKAQADYSKFIQQARKFTGDRIGEAFRTPQAKAAHAARKRGDYKECRKLFDQAILTDSTNPWLFDRFAYFLFHDERDYEAALYYAKKAVDLLPGEGEIWHTRGVIEARMGSFRDCTNSMDRAEQLGIEVDRCSIQRCWAYLKARPPQLELALKEMRKLKILLRNEPVSSRRSIELARIESRYKIVRASRSLS
jgi:tetratricopeptide (TPR) repeat protein